MEDVWDDDQLGREGEGRRDREEERRGREGKEMGDEEVGTSDEGYYCINIDRGVRLGWHGVDKGVPCLKSTPGVSEDSQSDDKCLHSSTFHRIARIAIIVIHLLC